MCIYLEYYDETLKEENNRRKIKGIPYSENELWYILKSLVTGLKFLK